MAIRLRYFARVRDVMGAAEETIDPGADVRDGAALVSWLAARSPDAADTLTHPSLRLAINGVVADRDAVVNDGDEVDLLPPFSGG